jgi:hypothetical protein
MDFFTLPKHLRRTLRTLLVIMLFSGISNASFAQQTAKKRSTDEIIADFKKANAHRSESQLKEAQAKLMKELCPNHPAYKKVSSQPGASAASNNAYESWKKNYPGEYAAYLKIFSFKY